MEDFTLAQKKQLETWATKRDEILKDISRLTIDKIAKEKENIELTNSNTDIVNQINEGRGRLAEILKQEETRATLVSREIVELEKQKTTLLIEIPLIRQAIVSLNVTKDTLISSIETLTLVHDKVFDRTGGLEAIVDHVKNVSERNLNMLINTFETIKKTSNEIIAVNQKNVTETMIVIDKLPRAILEYRRPVLPQRTIMSKRIPSNT